VIMVGNHTNIPQIAVTIDFASILNEQEQTLQFIAAPTTPQSGGLRPVHSRSPSDPVFLSPFVPPPSGGRMSPDVPPRSPSPSYASSIEGSSTVAPPSPTLSTQSSVHFATSVAPRDNKPRDRTSSLGLLNTEAKHSRKPSWASSGSRSSLDGTEPNHGVNGLSSVSMTLGQVGNLIRRHAPISNRLSGE
jgi:Ca2+-transporting ATPase